MEGVVALLDGDEIHDYAEARAWAEARLPEMAFTPQQIIEAASPQLSLPGTFDMSGVYFLMRGGRICYIGKAKELTARIRQHRRDRRPFESVAAIAGVHWEFIGVVEAAYVSAWRPPWNSASVYGASSPLEARLRAMDRSLVCTLPE